MKECHRRNRIPCAFEDPMFFGKSLAAAAACCCALAIGYSSSACAEYLDELSLLNAPAAVGGSGADSLYKRYKQKVLGGRLSMAVLPTTSIMIFCLFLPCLSCRTPDAGCPLFGSFERPVSSARSPLRTVNVRRLQPPQIRRTSQLPALVEAPEQSTSYLYMPLA